MGFETVFRLEVFAILVQLVLISVLFVLNFKGFAKKLKKVQKKIWILLFFILVFGLILRLEYLHAHHEDFGADEALYLELSENVRLSFQGNPCYKNEEYLRNRQTLLNKEDFRNKGYLSSSQSLNLNCMVGQSFPLPYSFFVALSSFFIDSFKGSSFFVSFLFGLLSVFLMFFLAYSLFNNELIALFAALFASFFPFFVEFSNSPNNFMISVFFIILSVTLMLLSIKLDTWKSWFLTNLVLVFTAITRDENILLLILLIFFVLTQKVNKKKFLFSLLIASLFYTPFLIGNIHPASVTPINSDWPSFKDLTRWPITTLPYHFFFNLNYAAHFSLWVLGLVGFFYLFKNKRASFYFLGSWFLIFFMFYIFWEGVFDGAYYTWRLIFSYIPLVAVSAAGMFYLFEKGCCFFRKSRWVVFLLLALIILMNINFLVHYPGRLGFNNAYSYLTPEGFDKGFVHEMESDSPHSLRISFYKDVKPFISSCIEGYDNKK